MIPLIWVAVGIVLVVGELLSGDLVLLMLGGAALGTAGASALGVPLGADLAVFAALAALLVLLARPTLRRRLGATPSTVSGTTRLLGTHGEVVEPVSGAAETRAPGTVRLGGAVWSARALHDDTVLDAGAPVVVVAVEGATAVVTPARPGQPESEPLQEGA